MSNGDMLTETSGTTPTLQDLYPEQIPYEEEDANEALFPKGPDTFPGYPSILDAIARWLFGPESE